MTADVTRCEHKQTAGILASHAKVLRSVTSTFELMTPGSNQLFGIEGENIHSALRFGAFKILKRSSFIIISGFGIKLRR